MLCWLLAPSRRIKFESPTPENDGLGAGQKTTFTSTMTHTSKLVVSDRPLVIPQALAFEIGLEAALILQQVHYWQSKGELKEDGCKWFHKTFKQWADELPLSMRAIRAGILKLRKLGLILVERKSARRYYQSNWYRTSKEAIKELWKSICPPRSNRCDRPDQIDSIAPDTSIYTETTPQENISTDTPPTPPKAAVEEEVKVEKYVPMPEELCAAERELRECRINPAAVMREVLRQFANFKGAIARVKEAQHQGWCTNPTGVFVKSIKLGLKPESPDFSRERFEIPEPPAGLEDWAIANSDSVKDFFYSSTHKCWRVVYTNDSQQNWWEAMGVEHE